MKTLEERVKGLTIAHIWTWTAGYEAPEFYQKRGYTIFYEMAKWYASGHSRVGLMKRL